MIGSIVILDKDQSICNSLCHDIIASIVLG